MEAFVLAPGLAEAIIAHAREGYPDEVCGIVAGDHDSGSELYRGQNVAPQPRIAFELDVQTLARQIEFAERGLELAAIYHSHPDGPAAPSPADIAQCYYPGAVYIICSLQEWGRPALRGFRLGGGQASEVALGGLPSGGPA